MTLVSYLSKMLSDLLVLLASTKPKPEYHSCSTHALINRFHSVSSKFVQTSSSAPEHKETSGPHQSSGMERYLGEVDQYKAFLCGQREVPSNIQAMPLYVQQWNEHWNSTQGPEKPSS